jgi:hypothetical protein
MPEDGIAAQVPTISDEPVGFSDVVKSQEVRLRHHTAIALFSEEVERCCKA